METAPSASVLYLDAVYKGTGKLKLLSEYCSSETQ